MPRDAASPIFGDSGIPRPWHGRAAAALHPGSGAPLSDPAVVIGSVKSGVALILLSKPPLTPSSPRDPRGIASPRPCPVQQEVVEGEVVDVGT